jgi:hypothetical protein
MTPVPRPDGRGGVVVPERLGFEDSKAQLERSFTAEDAVPLARCRVGPGEHADDIVICGERTQAIRRTRVPMKTTRTGRSPSR